MRRADRLFRLLQVLRGGRLTTAAKLAALLEVSERTIYRDIADLQASRVPIDGAAGVGYVMRSGFDMPPLTFTDRELSALVLGARLVSAWGGTEMQGAARDALSKIDSAVDRPVLMGAALERFIAPGYALPANQRAWIDTIDSATRHRRVLALVYAVDGRESRRDIRPIALWFWGAKWTFVAWCELRRDFRMFRIDRIEGLDETGRTFPDDAAHSLDAFMAQVREREGHSLPPDPLA